MNRLVELKEDSSIESSLSEECGLESERSYESIPIISAKSGVPTGRLGMIGAALFIVGEMTGSGILGVPQAISHAGFSGIGLMVLCVCVASYTGLVLSRNWMHVRDQYPFCSKPYQRIGYTAYGQGGEISVQICATVTLIGGCCAYILIAAQSLARFLFLELGSDAVEYRACVAIMALVFLLVLIFGAGKESLIVAIIATVLSIIFTGIILCGIIMTGKPDNYHPYKVTPKSWFLSFGKFLFAFGGHSAFPNFQKDMKNPRNFPGSILIAFLIKLVLYIPLGVIGMLFFGDLLHANILHNINEDFQAINVAVLLLVAVQAIMSATILGNPVVAMIDGAVNTPPNRLLSWKRILVRFCSVLGIVIICEAIPRFDLIMALIGGTTINTAVFILPCLFHMKLAKNDKWHKMKISFDILAIMFGVAAGCVCTYASIAHIVDEYSHP